MQKTQNLQDLFLNQTRKDRQSVTLFLMNGFQMRGIVRGFDSFTVVLETDGKQQLIYKNKFVHDTVYVGIRDSIPVPYPVEKELSIWDKFKVDYSGWMILVLLILLTCIVLLYRFRKS